MEVNKSGGGKGMLEAPRFQCARVVTCRKDNHIDLEPFSGLKEAGHKI